MVRPLRVQYPNAFYHVTSRGNERKDIFEDEKDRWAHIRLLRELVEQYGVVIHSWVQMTNHYHLLIETPDSNLALAMRHLNGV